MSTKPLPPCLIALVVVLLTGCGKKAVDTGWWEGEQERLDLAQRLALKEFRLIQRDGDATGELIKQQQSHRELLASRESLTAHRDDLKKQIQAMESGMITMREDFLQARRNQATGRTFDEFTTWNGRTYHQMSVSSVDDAGVTIRHANGSARLRYADLSDDQRQMFGLEAGRALAAMAKERAEAEEYEHWIDRRMVAIREKEAAQERLAAASVEATRSRTLATNTSQVVAANASPLKKPTNQVSSRYSSRGTRYRPSYSYYYYNVPVYRNPCVPRITYVNRAPELSGRCNPYTSTRIPYRP